MENTQKGFVVPLVIAIVVVLAAGGIYYVKHSNSVLNSGGSDISGEKSQVTIQVPENVDAYKKSVSDFVQIGGQDPVKNWKFVPMNVTVATTTDVIGTTAEMAARYIPTQGSSIPNQISYFKVVDGTAYVVLAIQEDGWAGVSSAIAMVKPIVEKSLLQFADIKKVEFKRHENGVNTNSPAVTKEQKLILTSKEVLLALKNKDYKKLESLTSSAGLSMNEYPDSLDLTKSDVEKNQISGIATDTNKRLWGYTDGKGDPINLSIAAYLDKWMYNHDYVVAPKIVVNAVAHDQGNTANNILSYSNGRDFVAFHFDGFDPKYAGMDWTTIYLIFDNENGDYKVRGIVKANWTI